MSILRPPTICITLPVLNEENRLEIGVRTLREYLKALNLKARIDIAENGSTDRTREIACELTRKYADVTLTVIPGSGFGRALMTSWAHASEDIVGYMDVDLSTDLKHFEQAVECFYDSQVDIVVGSRLRPESVVIGRKFVREVMSRVFNFILRFALGVKFSDGMCGFKFMRREAFNILRRNGLHGEGWFFSTEILVRGEWANLNVQEIPVKWTDAPGSHVQLIDLSRKYLDEILKLRRERRRYLG